MNQQLNKLTEGYLTDPRNPPNESLQERGVLALERIANLLESVIGKTKEIDSRGFIQVKT